MMCKNKTLKLSAEALELKKQLELASNCYVYLTEKSAIKQKRKDRYAADPEKVKKINKTWLDNNIEKRRAWEREYRRRKVVG